MSKIPSNVIVGLVTLALALLWLIFVLTPFVLFLSVIALPFILFWVSNSTRVPKILIVDDDEISIAPILVVIKKYSHPVKIYFAHNGQEALRKLQSMKFDLMILDYMMPLNGNELLEAAEKSQNVQPWTPVLFYTQNSESVRRQSKNYKKFIIQDILEKKLNFSILYLKISRQLQAC